MNIAIVNCFDTYEHRVDLLREAFVYDGHAVTVLTSDFRHFGKTKRTEPKASFVFFNAIPYHKNLSYQRLKSHYKLSKDIFIYLDTHVRDIDLIWILVPPNSFVKDAAIFKRNHPHVKVILDLIDLWPETMPVGSIKNFFPFSVWRKLRDNNVNCAELIVTECELYKDILSNKLKGIRTETLYLARPVQPFNPEVHLPSNEISLCYLGSINNIIDIEVIKEILQTIKKQKPVVLHIVGDGEKRDSLISNAENAGASVVFHGTIFDRNEKQKIFDSCHYGLNIMKQTVCVGLTMKSVDYLEFGLPLINNIHGDTWDIVNKYNVGSNWAPGNFPLIYSDEMRTNARVFFEGFLSSAVFSKKVNELIKEI